MLWSCVVRWVCVGVVAQASQHGGDFSHVAHHVRGYVPHPTGERVCVDGLHHLVCGAFNPAPTGSKNKVSFELVVCHL